MALSMPANLGLALAIAAGWLLTPWLMARLSQPVQISPANLSREQQRYLRQLSRETWGFLKHLSVQMTTFCRRIIIRKYPIRWWRIARHRPILGCRYWPT
ncbi:hypothetical protein PCI56_12305 [Plesiomonas shigelloides subsp. oncorhynchi]|nr:hypothetical protein [Plesiomonas shigelloides]